MYLSKNQGFLSYTTPLVLTEFKTLVPYTGELTDPFNLAQQLNQKLSDPVHSPSFPYQPWFSTEGVWACDV